MRYFHAVDKGINSVTQNFDVSLGLQWTEHVS